VLLTEWYIGAWPLATDNPVTNRKIDVSQCLSTHSFKNKLGRVIWRIVYLLFFRPSPAPLQNWRRFVLRLFGARIGKGAKILPSCKIWAPWNLEMGDYSCLSHDVDCYCVDRITIGAHATVSQYSYLCTATHDPSDPGMKLVTAPIVIEDQAWVCADVFVSPGVTVGQGTVVGARSSVFKDLPAWKICWGTPAKPVRDRIIKQRGKKTPDLPPQRK
jgi:putative colanic acid biosynthesis acetyltransferase WcaF